MRGFRLGQRNKNKTHTGDCASLGRHPAHPTAPLAPRKEDGKDAAGTRGNGERVRPPETAPGGNHPRLLAVVGANDGSEVWSATRVERAPSRCVSGLLRAKVRTVAPHSHCIPLRPSPMPLCNAFAARFGTTGASSRRGMRRGMSTVPPPPPQLSTAAPPRSVCHRRGGSAPHDFATVHAPLHVSPQCAGPLPPSAVVCTRLRPRAVAKS